MKTLSMMIIGLIGLSISTPALSGEYTDQVRDQLALIKLAGIAEGWEETHNDTFETLNNGDSDSFSLTLRKRTPYRIFAVCDNDCSDLDLTLYDENDNEISKDTSTDSIPIVEVTPKWTGEFSLKVKMYSCNNNPCYYGISILGK